MAEIKGGFFQPNYAVPPGETLRETLEFLGMTQAQLADRTGRPKKTINEIISGKAAITAETALQFERVLGVPASFWSNLERNYQEALARLKEEKELRSHKEWLKKFPTAAITKFGWLPKEDSSVKKLKAILNFFGVAGIEEWVGLWQSPQTAYRRSIAFQRDPYAVAAWLRQGEIEAQESKCKAYDVNSFKASLTKVRPLTLELPEKFEPEMKTLCEEAGVSVVFVPELPGTRVYGATRWLASNKALIQLSLRGKTDDHLWFTFFHEAGHILLHGKRDVFIEAKGEGCREMDTNDKEYQADKFSQDFLIPSEKYQVFKENGEFSLLAIKQFANELGIAPGIVVGRLQHDKVIPFSKVNNLKKRFRFAEN
jgi:addiction module HigA family antidote